MRTTLDFLQNKAAQEAWLSRLVAKFPGIAFDRDDVLQQARIALWQACETFDPKKGASLKTYATGKVWRAICTYHREGPHPYRVSRRDYDNGILLRFHELDAPRPGKTGDMDADCILPRELTTTFDKDMVVHQEFVRQAMVRLGERERFVVKRYYFDELTLRHIALEMGVSESRVYQIRAVAVKKMRQAVQS